MLDMGFIHALRRIAPLLPKNRQTMMFSATMPKLMADLSAQFLTNPVRVEVARPGVAAENIAQSVHFVAQDGKADLLVRLLTEHQGERALVFARTKHGAERLMRKLRTAGFPAASIHGNKSQGQRDRSIREFRSGESTILVATDVAARGIDIPNVKYVYNFDLPNVAENYIHRIGRTARAGASGCAVAFCAQDETKELRAIEKILKSRIAVAGGLSWEEGRRARRDERTSSRPKRGNKRRKWVKRAA
jgi:ATP-dependent RNA helicase RhlE